MKSFEDYLEKRFPDSRGKAYYLMAIHENLTQVPKHALREVGWSKAIELAKVARRDRKEFDCATWLHKAASLPKEEFKGEVEKHLTGRETEPWELIYFKMFKSQLPVVEQALETAELILGTDKSRGQVRHSQPRSRLGHDSLENLITLCAVVIGDVTDVVPNERSSHCPSLLSLR